MPDRQVTAQGCSTTLLSVRVKNTWRRWNILAQSPSLPWNHLKYDSLSQFYEFSNRSAWEAWVTLIGNGWWDVKQKVSQGEKYEKGKHKVTVTMLQLLSLFPGWNTRLLLGEFPWFQSPKDPNLFCMPSQILLSGVDRAPLPFWQGISLPGCLASTNSQ